MTITNEELNASNENLQDVLVRKLGIFELRALARELGISSPTTKRRNELVDLIIENRNNLQNLSLASLGLQRKGRPYKRLNTIDEIMNAVIQEDNQLIQAPKGIPTYESLICFAQEIPVFDHIAKEYRILSGVLRMTGVSAYYIDNKDGTKVFMPEDKIEQFNLTQGDMIKARCSKINNYGQFIVENVMEINFANVDEYVIKDCDLGRAIISREKLPFGNGMVCCGRRNVALYVNDIFEDEKFEDFAKDCNSRGVKVVVLGVNISFENDILYNSIENVTTFTTVYGSDISLGMERVTDAIMLCQKLIQRGEKVVMFINDMVEIIRTLDKYWGDADQQLDGHSAQSVIIAQKLLSLGRAYDGGLWTTLLVAYRDFDKADEFLNSELFKVSARVE